MSIIGCNTSSNSGNDSNSPQAIQTKVLSLADIQNFDSQTLEDDFDEFVQDNNDFALDLYNEIKMTIDSGNLFLSPYSLSCALAMVWAGAKGDTETQMAEVLNYSFSQVEMHALFNKFSEKLNSNDVEDPEAFSLYISNSLWGQDGFNFEQNYLDIISENYGSGLNVLNFISDPEKSRITINTWVEEQTGNRIVDLFEEGQIISETMFVLVNTIYFKADWLMQFNEDKTKKDDFITDGGDETIKIDMMNQINEFMCAVGSDHQAIELPYKNEKVSMIIVMPIETQFEAFEKTMSNNKIKSIISSMSKKQVSLSMPKFNFKYAPNAIESILQNMGMIDVFSFGTANFSGIAQEIRKIYPVVHKTFIKVDELGTEAAAASGIGGITTGGSQIDLEMKINRPFIFLIADKETDSILFIGRVMNPIAS